MYRLVQYGTKFIHWALESKKLSPELVTKLRGLESSISTARKCASRHVGQGGGGGGGGGSVLKLTLGSLVSTIPY